MQTGMLETARVLDAWMSSSGWFLKFQNAGSRVGGCSRLAFLNTMSTDTRAHYTSNSVSCVDDEEKMVDYEKGELAVDCVAPSRARSTLPTTGYSEDDRREKPQLQEQRPAQEQQQQQPAAPEPQQQPPAMSWSSSSHSSHSRHGHIGSISRISFDNVEFVHPRHRSRRWQLTYRGKGTFAQVYVGKSHHDSDPADVAIKFALDPSSQNIDRELRHEAEMMESVARVSPNAVCRLLFRPRPDDDVITMASGAQQPVFIAMELVDCDFGELERSGRLSRCALCEGFLLSFLALQDVHRSGVTETVPSAGCS